MGCGNGAFSQLIVDRCDPASVDGVDPAPAQLDFARTRPASKLARFHEGDAQALPLGDAQFDAAVMALVIFFVPDPAKGVAEMVRVTRPGGLISAYAWDILEGGFPLAPMQIELRALGVPPNFPPSVEAARIDALTKLWRDAGIVDVQTRQITVQRTFESFDEFWDISLGGSSIGPKVRALPPDVLNTLRTRLRERLAPGANGRITCSARANAVKGRLPSR